MFVTGVEMSLFDHFPCPGGREEAGPVAVLEAVLESQWVPVLSSAVLIPLLTAAAAVPTALQATQRPPSPSPLHLPLTGK